MRWARVCAAGAAKASRDKHSAARQGRWSTTARATQSSSRVGPGRCSGDIREENADAAKSEAPWLRRIVHAGG